jgi:hypothetical protein
MSLKNTFDAHERALGRDLTEARKVGGVGKIQDAQLSFGGGVTVANSTGPGDTPFTETLAQVAGVHAEPLRERELPKARSGVKAIVNDEGTK